MDKLQAVEDQVNNLDKFNISSSQRQTSNPLTHSNDSPNQWSAQQMIDKEEQIFRLTSELESVILRERSSSNRSAKSVALCEAKAAATRRYALELQTKLKDRESRIGNLEDTVDALSGRIESEISRGEKLGAQNITLKDHLEKQKKAISTISNDEIKLALTESNTRCCALETKLGGLSMEHRGAQRKMAKELDSRVRAMDTLRSNVEADVQTLKTKNIQLQQVLTNVCSILTSKGIEVPPEALVELADRGVHEQKQQMMETGDGSHMNEGDGGGGNNNDRVGRTKSRASRSPSPFRKFMGKRAASPGRNPNNGVSSSSSVASSTSSSGSDPTTTSDPSKSTKSAIPAFRRWSTTPTNNNGTVPPPQEANMGSSQGTSGGRETSPSSPSPISAPPRGSSGGGGNVSGGGTTGDNGSKTGGGTMTDLLQDRRNSSKEIAAQKHAARLKAVRTSSRGKWGFSV